MLETLRPFLEPLVAALGTALAAALTAFVTQRLRLANIQLDAEKQAQLEHAVSRGIAFAEEQAKNYLKQRGVPMTGADKQLTAESYVANQLPKADSDAVKQTIGALLPAVRGALTTSTPVAPVAPPVTDPNAPGR